MGLHHTSQYVAYTTHLNMWPRNKIVKYERNYILVQRMFYRIAKIYSHLPTMTKEPK